MGPKTPLIDPSPYVECYFMNRRCAEDVHLILDFQLSYFLTEILSLVVLGLFFFFFFLTFEPVDKER